MAPYCPLKLHAPLPRPPPPHAHAHATVHAATASASKNPISLCTPLLQGGVLPDEHTVTAFLRALAASAARADGAAAVHALAVKLGHHRAAYVRNALLALYAACGDVAAARAVFAAGSPAPDVVSWTTMLSCLARAGLPGEAVELFFRMADAAVAVDAVAAAAAFAACAELGDLAVAREVHRRVGAGQVRLDGIAWNALIDMYAKCGDAAAAYRCFKKAPAKGVVTWNTIIAGMARAGELGRALALFKRMLAAGLRPDEATFVGVLSACAQLGALDAGRWVHAFLGRSGREVDGMVGNALLDMYAKCGAIEQAMEVFDAMTCRDVYTYTSMILGLAMHGQGAKALDLFAEMSRVGMKPTEVTFVSVLSACCHAGLVDEGLRHFESMSALHGVIPTIEHYGCVVNLLGRAGMLDKAEKLIGAMPFAPDAPIWGSLLAACNTHGDVERAERVMQRMSETLEGGAAGEAGDYVLMSNMYASEGHHGSSVRVRKHMRKSKIRKVPGCSLIEIDGIVHEFRAVSPDKSTQ